MYVHTYVRTYVSTYVCRRWWLQMSLKMCTLPFLRLLSPPSSTPLSPSLPSPLLPLSPSLSLPLPFSPLSPPFPPSPPLPLSPSSILTGLRDVCVDWLNGEPVEDPAMKGEKDPKAGFKVEVPRKAVRPSSTQVHMCACVCVCMGVCCTWFLTLGSW